MEGGTIKIGVTRTEVKQRWEKANYKKYMLRLRYDSDTDVIEYLEDEKQKGNNTSDVIKDALRDKMK